MGAAHETVWREDFADGLDLTQRWALMTIGDFVADDAVATPDRGGVRVVPAGRNPKSGEPAFAKDGPSVLSRVKWFASTRQAFETGPAPVRIAFHASCRTFGVTEHPYGDAVVDADADLRLASFVLNVMDITTGMVFDFAMTAGAIYPIYERIALPGAGHEGFVSVGEPVTRLPSDVHALAIEIDVSAGTASWELDGTIVASAREVGLPDDRWATMIHVPGTREVTSPAQVVVSLGLFTMLDGVLPPSTLGLVDLGLPYMVPRGFVGGPSLFGQGIEAWVGSIEVTRH